MNPAVGDHDRAAAFLREAIAERERAEGPSTGQLVQPLIELATELAQADREAGSLTRRDEIVHALRRSVDLVITNEGPDAPQLVTPLIMLAIALEPTCSEDAIDEAIASLRQALRLIAEQRLGTAPDVLPRELTRLARLLRRRGRAGDAEEAIDRLAEVVDVLELRGESESAAILKPRLRLADALIRTEGGAVALRRAAGLLHSSIELIERDAGPQAPELVQPLLAQAYVMERLVDRDAAAAAARRAGEIESNRAAPATDVLLT